MPSRKKSSPETDVTPASVEPPWWRPPRSTRRRQPLTRQAIVEAAVRILDAEGFDALTVRRLGQELNTGSATLYWHIGNKEELGELVYDHVMGEMVLPEPDPTRWREQLKDFARQCYRVMLSHNDFVRLSIGRIPVGPNSLRMIEWMLDLTRQVGIPDQAAAYFGDMLGRYLDASVLETTAQTGPDPELVGNYFVSLPENQFPNIIALSGAMLAGDDQDRFEFGLDLLVGGLAAYVPTGRRGRRC